MTQLQAAVAAQSVRRWQPYPSYKDSGVEWLGEVPSYWDVAPVYSRYSVQLGKMLNPEAAQGASLAPYLRNANIQWDRVDLRDLNEMQFDLSERRKYALAVNDLLICEGGEVGRTAIWRGELDECYIQNAVHRVRPQTGRDTPRFLYYAMYTAAHIGVFEAEGNRSTIVHLTAEKLKTHRFAYPPLAEQLAIVAFLDRETTRIDTLVAAKERLIALLQEKRAALISHSVTRGLDPVVPLKDSTIPAIGPIPSHWKLRRNKNIYREVSERSVTGAEELLTVSHITGVTPRREKDVNMFMAETLEGYKLCRSHDLAINTMWAWMGALGIVWQEGLVSPSYNVYRLKQSVCGDYEPRYLDMLYRTRAYICEINRYSQGIWQSRLRLYPQAFFEMYTPTPPIDEQRAIVTYCAGETSRIEAFITKLTNSIDKLKEYRAALISAAVTGKIDVRDEEPAHE